MIVVIAVQTAAGAIAEGNAAGWSVGALVGTGVSVATVFGGGLAWLLSHISEKEKGCAVERAEMRKQISDITDKFTTCTDRQTERFIEAIREDRREHRELLGRILRRQTLDGPHDGPHS